MTGHDHFVVGEYMWAIWILLAIGFGLLLIWFIRKNQQKGKGSSNSALETLDQRFANGEIDEEEYKQKKKDLIE